jgi:uncharacterized UBP type Zn finger protein
MDKRMSNENTDMIISMAMDMMNDNSVDNARIVRACLFAACIVSISQSVKLPTLEKILTMLYRQISVSIGIESIFEPGES